MCGRYLIDEHEFDMQDFLEELGWQNDGRVRTGEIYPTDTVPILQGANGKKRIAAVKWGFPLHHGGGTVINARSETASEKSMFRKSLLERRCAVPSSGFYEWQCVEGQKRKNKYHITLPGSGILYMAGMWNTFHGSQGEYPAFVILTTKANDSMIVPNPELSLFPDEHRPIHDRMPIILSPDEISDWLTDDLFTELVLHRPGPELEPKLMET